MKIIISNNSSVPIYEQIKNMIKAQILSGELGSDSPLPSIRMLAKDIRISVMTIKKAYDELEEEGFIVTRQGKGSFVAPTNLEFLKEQKQKEIEEYINKIVDISTQYQIGKEEILDLFEFLYRKDDK